MKKIFLMLALAGLVTAGVSAQTASTDKAKKDNHKEACCKKGGEKHKECKKDKSCAKDSAKCPKDGKHCEPKKN